MTRTRRTSRLLRLLVGIACLALLGGAALVPSVPETDAAWNDAEVGAARFEARTVPTPIIAQTPGCVASGGALGLTPSVTIHWRFPPEASGYTLADVEFGEVITAGVLEPLLGGLLGSTTTTETAGRFQTVVNSGLLTGLLGGSKSFGIRVAEENGWSSDWLVAHASMGLAGLNPRCSTEVVPS